jgi:solute carrier family 6 GABA transporter-like protein 1
MLLNLGLDTQFSSVESLMTGLVDNWPEQLRPHRKKFTLGMTVFMCLLGLPMITRVSQSEIMIDILLSFPRVVSMCSS